MILTIFSKLQGWRKIFDIVLSWNHDDKKPLSLKCIASTSDATFWWGTLAPLYPVARGSKSSFGRREEGGGRRGQHRRGRARQMAVASAYSKSAVGRARAGKRAGRQSLARRRRRRAKVGREMDGRGRTDADGRTDSETDGTEGAPSDLGEWQISTWKWRRWEGRGRER